MLKKSLFLLFLFLAKTCFIALADNVPYSNLPIHLKYNDVSNADKPLLKKGFIDVTKAPYNAKGDNVTDDTQAIQAALIDAYNYNFVTYLPGDKTYLVSQQLSCVTTTISREKGYQMVGSTNGVKPVIRLADNASASFVATEKILVLYKLSKNGVNTAASNYSACFRGIDINMGLGNSTISALSMDGAQDCTIEDVKISGDFYAGITKLPGSGGYVVNLEVIGGQIGILQNAFRPTPTIIGLKLENQTQYGILHTDSRGPMVISGFQIKSPTTPSPSYRAISLNSTYSVTINGIIDHGVANLCLTDGSIEVGGFTGLAIENLAQDVTINNVFIKAATIINSGAGGGSGSIPQSLSGNASIWNKITNYIFTSKLDKSTVVCNLIELNNRIQNYQKYNPLILEAPSIDFTTLHSWSTLPSWEDKKSDGTTSNVIDITEGITINGALYRATSEVENATDDDGIAMQKIIDEVTTPTSSYYGMNVFIPRGYFHIKKTLKLKSRLKLMGSIRGNSIIEPLTDWINTTENPAILLESENVVTGSLFLSDIGIQNYAHSQILHLQTPNTFIRGLGSRHVTDASGNGDSWNISVKNPPAVPYFLFNNNVGGKFYNIVLGGAAGSIDAASATWNAAAGKSNYFCGTDYVVPLINYHILKVESNSNPLVFYHFNVEGLKNSPQMFFNNAKNITVHGFKYEFDYELLEMLNSDNIKFYGGSGNYQLIFPSDRGIFVIRNSTNIFIENFERREITITTPPIVTNWISQDGNLISGDYGILHYDNFGAETAIRNTTFKNNNVLITPNPTKDFIDVAFNDYSDFAGSQLKIQNCMGRQVFNKEIISNKTQVDSKSWGASGIYFVSVSTKNGELIEAKKIIKQ